MADEDDDPENRYDSEEENVGINGQASFPRNLIYFPRSLKHYNIVVQYRLLSILQ